MNDIAEPKPITAYTSAPVRIETEIEFSGHSGEEIFDIMGDPKRITDWYLLAKSVHMHPPGPGGEDNFNVEFIYFGDVFEEILDWDPPRRYVYKATGDQFPIKDYVAVIEVTMTGDDSGTMRWAMHFDDVEGMDQQKALPVMLPPITEESVKRLAPMLGGQVTLFQSNFDGIAV